ncbi:hypothetical protein NEOLI_005431 [Neolecta irregularis DAH-3]|uniref:Uncharacterized protein n=1 Tax=Neolecta irregularis (strain DAH-3) TaxID=1198029 RepID=A0A1U7LGX8_NEOID|nr:hypothetical protein NEOLI_005431 [Neolecta irregularis DAH-3]|eukprot:OLL21899.1 hypothetical protein NEOLI_005431 [Neolecta irregularis DAH-3]
MRMSMRQPASSRSPSRSRSPPISAPLPLPLSSPSARTPSANRRSMPSTMRRRPQSISSIQHNAPPPLSSRARKTQSVADLQHPKKKRFPALRKLFRLPL